MKMPALDAEARYLPLGEKASAVIACSAQMRTSGGDNIAMPRAHSCYIVIVKGDSLLPSVS